MTELDLTPQQIVKELDKHIIGQKRAKRAVAIALRTSSAAGNSHLNCGRRSGRRIF